MKIKGFTLIELLVVVIIIGIFAAIAIPKFSKHPNRSSDYTEVTPSHSESADWSPTRYQDVLPTGTVVTCYSRYNNADGISCVIDPRQFTTP